MNTCFAENLGVSAVKSLTASTIEHLCTVATHRAYYGCSMMVRVVTGWRAVGQYAARGQCTHVGTAGLQIAYCFRFLWGWNRMEKSGSGGTMHRRIIAALVASAAAGVLAQSQDLATCRNPTGKAFRHFSGAQSQEDAGWSDERISNGAITITQAADGHFDLLYVDGRNKPISMTQEGAKVVVLRSGPNELLLLSHYEATTTELYSFFREKDGKNRYTVMTSRTGPRAVLPKSSLMVGDCDPIRFDLIK